jgi:hypothetical protein
MIMRIPTRADLERTVAELKAEPSSPQTRAAIATVRSQLVDLPQDDDQKATD